MLPDYFSVLMFQKNFHLLNDFQKEEKKDQVLDGNISKEKMKPLLVIINPKSGSGNAEKIFRTDVEPKWKKYRISYETLVTKYANHASKYIKRQNLQSYSGIVAVGGDGTLAEVFSGLDLSKQNNKQERRAKTTNDIAIGIIPLGSGNGLAASLLFSKKRKYSVKEAAKMIAQKITEQLDLMRVSQNGQEKTGFLALGFGYIPDLDIKSETYRWLGKYRFILGAIQSIWNNKVYSAQLSYLPEGETLDTIPSLEEPRPANFKVISGYYSLVIALKPSHLASDAHAAPGAAINDGYLHVITIGKVSRLKLLYLLWGLESGSYVNDPSVSRFKTKVLRIEKLSSDATLTFDGEPLPPKPIQCRIEEAAIKVFCGYPDQQIKI